MTAPRDGIACDEEETDIAEFYRRNERALRRWLARRVNAPAALVEDACSIAWLTLLRRRSDVRSATMIGWLRTTALHEAYGLLRRDQRERPSEILDGAQPLLALARRDDEEIALESKRALLAVASLPERASRYVGWRLGGYTYREIQVLAGDATYTNVNAHIQRAHKRLLVLAEEGGDRLPQFSEKVLRQAKRLYESGYSMRVVARALLEHTGYANAYSAEASLRSEFKRRGWSLRRRAQARRVQRGITGESVARAA
jgi:hypothetical protein